MTRPGRQRLHLVLAALLLLATAAVGPATVAGAEDGAGSNAMASGSSEPLDPAPVNDDLRPEGMAPVLSADRITSTLTIETLGERLGSLPTQLAKLHWQPPVAVLLFGYARSVDRDPLDHDVRERVYDQVRSTPGAHIAAIADESDVPRSTVRYHLRVLEDAELIEGATVRGRHRYVPIGHDLQRAAALHDAPTRAVLEAVARFEPVGLTGLADEVRRAPSTVSHHLDVLEEAGLLTRERQDGRVSITLDGVALDSDSARPSVPSETDVRAELTAE